MSFGGSQMVCSICQKGLDIASRWPRLIPNTGETICQPCASQIVDQTIDSKLIKHLFDDLNQLRDQKKGLQLDDFPLNAILLRYLQIQKSQKKLPKNRDLKAPNSSGCGLNKENIFQEQSEDQSIGKILIDGDIGDALTTSVEDNFNLEELSVKKKKPQSKILKQKLQFTTQSGISQGDMDDSFTSYNSFKANIQNDGNLCEIHRRHLEVVCLECHNMICTNCALFGSHRGHNIYSKEDVLIMLEKKGEELYEQLEKLHQNLTLLGRGIYEENFKDVVKTLIKQHHNQIKKEFDQLRSQLNDQESQCLKQVSDQMSLKLYRWNSWWESQANHKQMEDQIQEWIRKTETAFEKLSDKADGSYWDKITLVDCQKVSGKQLESSLCDAISKIKSTQSELSQQTLTLSFNSNIKSTFDNFCRVTCLQRNASFLQFEPEVNSRKVINIQTRQTSVQHEDSDLLQDVNFSMGDHGRGEQSCYDALQQSPFGMNSNQINNECSKIFSTSFSTYQATQPFFGPAPIEKSASKSKNTSFSLGPNQLNQSRLHRSTTPQEKLELLDHSLSPLGPETSSKMKQSAVIENLSTLRQSTRKKANQIHLKLGNLLEELRKGKFEATLDLSNLEFNQDLGYSLGQDMKYWKVKTIKLMKCKMQDDHLETFLASYSYDQQYSGLGSENDSLQSINLAQNLLTDRAIEIILQLKSQRVIGPAMKNIILSHNKINARHCKDQLAQLKTLCLTITL